MTNKRMFWIMVSLTGLSFLIVAATAIGGLFLLKGQSDKLVALKLENQTLEEQDRAITLAQQDIQKYQELAETAQSIVPQDKDQAKTIREIDRIAAESRIRLDSFGFEASTLGEKKKTTAKTPTTTDSSSASTATPKTPAAPPVTQVEAVPGINDVYQLPVTTQATGYRTTYPALIGFLQGLENNRRTAQVQQISIQPDAKNPSLLNFTMQFNVYLRP